MFPRLHVFIVPTAESGVYRVRVVKGWWKGPGNGATTKDLCEFTAELPQTAEKGRICAALRMAAAALD